MQKKSHSTWQSSYFQVKNGYLYQFKDKGSSIIQNKISIKNTLRVHKEKKFMMVVSFNNSDAKESQENKENEKDEEKSK